MGAAASARCDPPPPGLRRDDDGNDSRGARTPSARSTAPDTTPSTRRVLKKPRLTFGDAEFEERLRRALPTPRRALESPRAESWGDEGCDDEGCGDGARAPGTLQALEGAVGRARLTPAQAASAVSAVAAVEPAERESAAEWLSDMLDPSDRRAYVAALRRCDPKLPSSVLARIDGRTAPARAAATVVGASAAVVGGVGYALAKAYAALPPADGLLLAPGDRPALKGPMCRAPASPLEKLIDAEVQGRRRRF